MGAGNYPLRIKVIDIPLTQGDDGGLAAGTAVEIAERWMRIDPVSGAERFGFGQQQASVTHRFEFRQHITGITPKMKLLYGARLFEIVAVMHDENKKRWTRLICDEYPEIPVSIVLGMTGQGIKALIARGFGFSLGTTRYIPTLGLSPSSIV